MKRKKVQLGWCPLNKRSGRLITSMFSYGRAGACALRSEKMGDGVKTKRRFPVVCVELHIRRRSQPRKAR